MTDTVIEIVPLTMEEGVEEKPQHFCGICYESFDSEDLLEIHCHTCSEKMTFLCGVCQLSFEHEEEMLQHRANEHHEEMEGMITDLCAAEMSNGMDLDNDEYKPFVCNVCCEAFQSIETLNEHTSVHIENKAVTCNTRFLEFTNLESYVEHRITHQVNERGRDSEMSHHEVKDTNGDNGMSYNCRLCSKTFSSTYGWNQHQKAHIKDHQCNLCERSFPLESKLIQHMQIHTADRPYKCHKCDQGFFQRYRLIEHLQLHEEEEDYHSCAICKKLFHQKSSLDQHMRTHKVNSDQKAWKTSGDNEIKYGCTLCGKSFSFETELKQHMTTHIGNRPYKCHRCKKAFMRKAHLQNHMYVHNDVDHSCTICKKSFKQKYRLLMHMKTHNTDDNAITVHKCKRCHKAFISPEYLAAHVQAHPENHFTCYICQSTFNKNLQLNVHLLEAHDTDKPTVNIENKETTNDAKGIEDDTIKESDEKVTNFPCGYCDETFTLEAHLNQHFETHSALKSLTNYRGQDLNKHIGQHYGKKNYTCLYEDCGNSYQFQHEWKLHMKYHKEKGQEDGFHLCPYCKKQFIHKFNLDAHTEMHSGENPYQCELCSSVFSTQSELDVHKAVHVNEKKYSCDKCGKLYKREWEIRRHILDQHPVAESVPVPKYRCSRCKETFTAKADLIVHLETHRAGDMYYTCKTCYKVFNGKDSFDNHQLTCVSSHRCTRCLKIFTSKTEYAQHLSTHTSGSGNNICLECNKVCRDQSAYEQHLLKMHKEKWDEMLKSKISEKSQVYFKTPSAKFVDISGKKPYECDQCGEVIKNSEVEVAAHLLKHSREKVFQCKQCNAKFATAVELNKHVEEHDSGKIHACTLCSRQCGTQTSLKIHMRKLHPESFNVSASQEKDNVEKRQSEPNVESVQMDLNDQELKSEVTVKKEVVEKKLFQCKLCNALFMTTNKLIEHVNNHHANTCTLCGRPSNSQASLKKHVRMVHNEEYDAIMNATDLSDLRPNLEARVTKEEVEERLFKCKICDALFTTTNKLINHAYTCHTDGSHTCTFCGRQTSSQTHLKNHMRMVHQGAFSIGVVSQASGNTKKFQTGHNVQNGEMDFNEPKLEYVNKNDSLKKFQCHTCSQSFVSVFFLNQHIEKAHHTNVSTVFYKCKYCSKAFDKKHYLQMHMKTHQAFTNRVIVGAGVKLHKCEYCSKAFDTKYALESHGPSCIFSSIRNHDQQGLRKRLLNHAVNKPLKCETCQWEFKSKQRYQSHMLIHRTGSSNYPCTKCHKVFANTTHLNAHMKVHQWEDSNHNSSVKRFKQQDNRDMKDKVVAVVAPNLGVSTTSESKQNSELPYKCEDCDLSFRRELSLKNHALIHKVEKPHQCAKCSRCFKTMNELQIHAKDHVHEKPYSCTFCDKSFGTRETLVGHFRLHTGKDLHQCAECGKMFIDKASLKKHQSVHY